MSYTIKPDQRKRVGLQKLYLCTTQIAITPLITRERTYTVLNKRTTSENPTEVQPNNIYFEGTYKRMFRNTRVYEVERTHLWTLP